MDKKKVRTVILIGMRYPPGLLIFAEADDYRALGVFMRASVKSCVK